MKSAPFVERKVQQGRCDVNEEVRLTTWKCRRHLHRDIQAIFTSSFPPIWLLHSSSSHMIIISFHKTFFSLKVRDSFLFRALSRYIWKRKQLLKIHQRVSSSL